MYTSLFVSEKLEANIFVGALMSQAILLEQGTRFRALAVDDMSLLLPAVVALISMREAISQLNFGEKLVKILLQAKGAEVLPSITKLIKLEMNSLNRSHGVI